MLLIALSPRRLASFASMFHFFHPRPLADQALRSYGYSVLFWCLGGGSWKVLGSSWGVLGRFGRAWAITIKGGISGPLWQPNSFQEGKKSKKDGSSRKVENAVATCETGGGSQVPQDATRIAVGRACCLEYRACVAVVLFAMHSRQRLLGACLAERRPWTRTAPLVGRSVKREVTASTRVRPCIPVLEQVLNATGYAS